MTDSFFEKQLDLARKALSMKCPTCGRRPGNYCLTPDGVAGLLLHRDRVERSRMWPGVSQLTEEP